MSKQCWGWHNDAAGTLLPAKQHSIRAPAAQLPIVYVPAAELPIQLLDYDLRTQRRRAESEIQLKLLTPLSWLRMDSALAVVACRRVNQYMKDHSLCLYSLSLISVFKIKTDKSFFKRKKIGLVLFTSTSN